MQEVKIPPKSRILPLGAIGSIALFVIAGVFFNAANRPGITSPTGVRMIAALLIVLAFVALFLVVREIFFPRHLIINEEGINNQLSFGLLKWDNVESVGRFEGMVGFGRYRALARGIAIQVRDKDALLKQISGTRRFGAGYAENKWGTPAVVYSSTWSLNIDLIEEVLQRYSTEFGKRSTEPRDG